jgi:hypothetical protein
MLKEQTTSEKAMADVRQQHLDTREDLLKRQRATINELLVESQKMLVDAKELYASVEA